MKHPIICAAIGAFIGNYLYEHRKEIGESFKESVNHAVEKQIEKDIAAKTGASLNDLSKMSETDLEATLGKIFGVDLANQPAQG